MTNIKNVKKKKKFIFSSPTALTSLLPTQLLTQKTTSSSDTRTEVGRGCRTGRVEITGFTRKAWGLPGLV